jgi:hypothetical protein
MDLTIVPVLEDEELGEVLKRLGNQGLGPHSGAFSPAGPGTRRSRPRRPLRSAP